jgi:hypothetical protein
MVRYSHKQPLSGSPSLSRYRGYSVVWKPAAYVIHAARLTQQDHTASKPFIFLPRCMNAQLCIAERGYVPRHHAYVKDLAVAPLAVLGATGCPGRGPWGDVLPVHALSCGDFHPQLGPHGAPALVVESLLFPQGLEIGIETSPSRFGFALFRAEILACTQTASICMVVDVPYELEGLLGRTTSHQHRTGGVALPLAGEAASAHPRWHLHSCAQQLPGSDSRCVVKLAVTNPNDDHIMQTVMQRQAPLHFLKRQRAGVLVDMAVSMGSLLWSVCKPSHTRGACSPSCLSL